ncbi:hypothetical protein [Litchfieldia alkalitelluris]|uniref:hypothetical protein n=1 Tax=Litchfieldia alkalitelluris TaxID=304268 RepID=UPI0009964C7A|nr:hypothetical protein [Litchfieldia alkalitelluris]
MTLTLAHWLYGIVTVIIILTMIFRKGIVLPTLLGTFLIAWIYQGSIVSGFTAVFNANLTAAKELFSIFLIITFMVALLQSLKDLGADRQMISPIQKIMTNGHIAYFVLIIVTYVISLFFWPTPAVPLICALLVPAAVRAGLPVMAAAMAVSLAGQGMALSSDYVMQIAPSLSAKSGGLDQAAVADKALVLSLISGITAILIGYLATRKKMRKADDSVVEKELEAIQGKQKESDQTISKPGWSKLFAVLVPLSMLAVIVYMIFTKVSVGRMGGFEGSDGAAFIGGVTVLLLSLATISYGKIHALNRISDHITEGFVFAFKAMGPVIPIAGFFFLGSSDFSASILSIDSNESPAFLFDLVQASQAYIPNNSFISAFGILIIGIITGLDGSGFSGLPLTGSLSSALSSGSIDPTTLAAIGQMGSIWTGGGTLIAWSSLVAVAGLCGISVMELVRKNFWPVIIGLMISTFAALLIW